MKRNLQTDLATLQLEAEVVDTMLAHVPDGPNAWEMRTGAFHEMVKSARKTQLRKWHPDICKDPQAVERSAEINAAADGLLTLRLGPPRVMRPVVQQFVVIWQNFGGFWGNSTSSSTGTWTTTGL